MDLFLGLLLLPQHSEFIPGAHTYMVSAHYIPCSHNLILVGRAAQRKDIFKNSLFYHIAVILLSFVPFLLTNSSGNRPSVPLMGFWECRKIYTKCVDLSCFTGESTWLYLDLLGPHGMIPIGSNSTGVE